MSAKSYRAKIEAIEDLAPGTRVLVLRLPRGHGLEFQAGQFVSFQLPIGGETIVRPYTIASDPADAERLEVVFDRVADGPGSTYLSSLSIATEIDFTGPWGTFVLGDPAPARCVFVAMGTGIAPLRPMVRAWCLQPELAELRLIHAAPAETGLLLYRSELEQVSRADARFRYEAFVESADEDSHAALTAHLRQRYVEADGDRTRHFFLCGVGDIVLRLRDLLRGAGYERRAVHYEKW